MKKILGLFVLLSMSLVCFAEEDELSSDAQDLSNELEAPAKKSIASEPVKPSGFQVSSIPLNTKLGDSLIGNKIVDHDKGVTCYTIVHVGHTPQLWCTK